MGIMAANRIFLLEIGALDGGMLGYGGENVELSLRVCTCSLLLYVTKQEGMYWKVLGILAS